MADQFLITWIKPKPRRQCGSNVSQTHMFFFIFCCSTEKTKKGFGRHKKKKKIKRLFSFKDFVLEVKYKINMAGDDIGWNVGVI